MTSTKEIGAKGEAVAQKYLQELDYRILQKNVTSHYGEIDLIAQKKNCLYFVEIRYRKGDVYGSALESISTEKQKRIRKTAEYFLFTHQQYQNLIPFFSAIAIDETLDGVIKIEFLPDAFE